MEPSGRMDNDDGGGGGDDDIQPIPPRRMPAAKFDGAGRPH